MAKQNKKGVDDTIIRMADLHDLHDLDVLVDGDGSNDEEEVEVVGDVLDEQGRLEDVATPGKKTAEQDHTLLYKSSVMNIGLENLDLGHMVNGYPGDPIDLRPNGKSFTRPNILKWWRKVGFLPMTRVALNDPKVRWELGDGGAPKEAGKRLALLEEAYREGAAELQVMGHNKLDVFELELQAAKPKLDMNNEEKIPEYTKQGTMKTGNMMKISEVIVNSEIAVEAWKRRNAQTQEKKEEKGGRRRWPGWVNRKLLFTITTNG